MKARRKGSNDPFREISHLSLKGSSLTYCADAFEFEQEQEPIDHWQAVRQMAAIAAMQGVMNFFGSLDYDRETIAKLAVEQADALIKELKGGLV